MMTTKIVILILAIAVLLYILIPGLSWSEDGTVLHRAAHSVSTRCECLQDNLRPAAQLSVMRVN